MPQEVTILNEVARACEALLATTFEGYHSLSEKEPAGILSGGASGPESPAPALRPAVRLFGAWLAFRSDLLLIGQTTSGLDHCIISIAPADMRVSSKASYPDACRSSDTARLPLCLLVWETGFYMLLAFLDKPCPAVKDFPNLSFPSPAGILKEEGLLRDQVWLQDRLRVAAARRYHRLHRNCVKRITENGAGPARHVEQCPACLTPAQQQPLENFEKFDLRNCEATTSMKRTHVFLICLSYHS